MNLKEMNDLVVFTLENMLDQKQVKCLQIYDKKEKMLMAELMAVLGSENDDLYTEIIKENLEHRTLIFNDEVNDALIENYMLYILKWNREDKDIDPSKRKKITIVLNSPGGDCMIGFGGMVNCIE